MTCSQCQAMNDRDSLFCANCGTSLTRSVPGPGGPGAQPQSTILTGYGQGAPRAAEGYHPPSLPADEYAQGAPRRPYAPRHHSPAAPSDLYSLSVPASHFPPNPPGTPSDQYSSSVPASHFPPNPPGTPSDQYSSSVPASHFPPNPPGTPSDQYSSSVPASHFPPNPPGDRYSSGARVPYSPGAHVPRAHAPAGAFHLDLRRLSRVDQTVGGASLVLFISLFLPWFGLTVLGSSVTISGTSTHGYLVLVAILAVVLIAYLVLRSGWDEFPVNLPVAHAPLLLIGTGLQFLLVVIGFFSVPSGLNWEIGAYLALIASGAAAGPVIIPAIRSWQASR